MEAPSLFEMFEDPYWIEYTASGVELYLGQMDVVLNGEYYENYSTFFGAPEVQAISPGSFWVWLYENEFFAIDAGNLGVIFDHWRSRAAAPNPPPLASQNTFQNERIQVWVRTEIRPPYPEDGTKTFHVITINEYGSRVAEAKFIGITPDPWPLPGVGILDASVTGTHPEFNLAFSGTALSLYPTVGGTLSGLHDGFPSYEVFVEGNKVYDYQQTNSLSLLPPMDVTLSVQFSW